MLPNTRKRKSRSYTFTATCATGLEELVAEELIQCGAENAVVKPGAISWTASGLESITLTLQELFNW